MNVETFTLLKMNKIEILRQKHEKEIEELQSGCSHKKSKRTPFYWAVGHYSHDVEVCSSYGKTLKVYGIQPADD